MERLKHLIAAVAPEARALRREFHAHPELGFEETWTSDRIVRFLGESGISCRRGFAGGTGIVADLGAGHKCVAFRAEMDALEIQERSDLAHASRIPNRMHACGHDGHLACLCGLAKILTRCQDELPVRVRLIFQPAEEPISGAARMVAEGVMDGVDAIFALHTWPGLPVGSIGLRAGTIMAGANRFRIAVHGKGCHGAEPHAGVDTVVVAAHIVVALQTIVSREFDPLDTAVVTIGHIAAGAAPNVIPETAVLEGTCRTLTVEAAERLASSLRRIAAHTAQAFRATAETVFIEEPCPPTVNDPGMIERIRQTAAARLGHEKIVEIPRPSMAAEDFSLYLQHAPGALVWLGNAPANGPSPALHTPCFDFNDEAIPTALTLFSALSLEGFRV